MKKNFLSKIIKFNIEDGYFVTKLVYLNDDGQAFLEQVVEDNNFVEIVISNKKRDLSQTDSQRHQFFRDLTKILVKMGVPPTAENKKVYRVELLETYAPVKYVDFGGSQKPLPPSLTNLNLDELAKFIQDVRDVHQYLDIDWEA